jgi:hypothetical protein
VIDRSGSMAEKADNNVTKWDGLKTSLGAVLDENAGKAYWGLMLFPSGTQTDSCQAGTVDVPIALGDEAAVKSAVNAYSTQQISLLRGRTPTSATMPVGKERWRARRSCARQLRGPHDRR